MFFFKDFLFLYYYMSLTKQILEKIQNELKNEDLSLLFNPIFNSISFYYYIIISLFLLILFLLILIILILLFKK